MKIGDHGGRLRARQVLLAAGACLGCAGLAAAQPQWTVINLHPAGESNSRATGVWETTQVGTGGLNSALLWRGWSATAMRLNPNPSSAASATSIWNGQQGGVVNVGGQSHASIWNGTAQSWVDLHPTHIPEVVHTDVFATDGQTQVGTYYIPAGGTFAGGAACMWSGTADSWVDLHPAGYGVSEAHGVFGNQQVGTVWGADLGNAVMWFGSAESMVLLAPPEAIASAALCTDGTHQYGMIGILEPVPGLYPARWSGTAESWENMGVPEGRWGEIHAVHGGWKVGFSTTAGELDARAYLWTDGPGSYIDLHPTLPPEYTTSNAQGIWRHEESGTTYIVGHAHNSVLDRDEAIMWVTGPGVNLITSATAPADCSAAPGDQLTFTARILNAGAESSGPVTLTVHLPPAGVATFASSTPAPSTVSPTQITIDLPDLSPLGGHADVSVTLTAVGQGAAAELIFEASAAGEVHAANNTASAASVITPVPPATAAATAIFSTDPLLPNSQVPGGVARFTELARPVASPSGNWWAMQAETDGGAVLLRAPAGGAASVILQEGVTATPNGTLTDLLRGVEINDAGTVAFGGTDSGEPGSANFVATTDGATITDAAREGMPIPAIPGESYGPGIGGSVNIFDSGAVGFYTNTRPGFTTAYLSDDGDTLIALRDVTIPEGALLPIWALSTNTAGTGGVMLDATGAHHIYEAQLMTGLEEDNGVIVVDGSVVLHESVTILPGMSAPVVISAARFTMAPGGAWMLRGSNSDGAGWAVRGLGPFVERVFKEGDPIHAGATETWRADPGRSLFFAQLEDGAGNFLLGGTTDNPDGFSNAVLVYNDQEVIARENDPVDLDGNGVFDDGVYIRSFEPDLVALLPDAALFVVTLRDEDAALCRTNDESRGLALVRVALPGGGCPADWDDSGSVNSNDISAFLSAWLASVQQGDLIADFDGSGQVNSNDISAFLNAWLQAVQQGC